MEHANNDGAEAPPRKRGMKPRSKRNRKRARATSPINFQTQILPLKLQDTTIQPLTHVRVVEPYRFSFATFAKARWIGRSVLDVYCSEFGSYPKSIWGFIL